MASVVVSDIPDCQYSVSVTVSTTLGQVRVCRQRSSWPPMTPEMGSKLVSHVWGDSPPGNCASVCWVPDRRVGCAPDVEGPARALMRYRTVEDAISVFVFIES